MKVQASLHYDRSTPIGVGQGRNSSVYLINEPQLGGTMAVKEIDKGSLKSPADYFKEAQAMFATAHPNIVPIQYACETNDLICLVMPFYKNGSLSDRINSGPVSPREATRIGIGVLDGLSKIHGAGFVHFDIKPTNVFFSDANVPMVADFGQAMPMSPSGMSTVPRVYAIGAAPEFFRYPVSSPLSDIYHVGLLLYRAVNGDPFFAAQYSAPGFDYRSSILSGRFPNRDAFLPHVPRRLRTIIRKALNVDPDKRQQSAVELARELGRVSIGLDWNAVIAPDGRTTWTAKRPGQPDLVVEKQPDGSPGAWNVCAYTERGGTRRVKDAARNSRNGLTSQLADLHLKTVFQTLE